MNKTMMRIFVLMLSLILVACCLVACGDKDKDNTDNDGGNTNTELQKFTGITFEGATFDFDGEEHEILCEGVPEGASVEYTNNKATLDGTYNAKAVISKEGYETLTLNATMTIVMTADAVVEARATSNEKAVQNYDFLINLQTVVAGVPFNGNYTAQYRYNRSTNDLKFKRLTSGSLLYDAYEWIYNDGESKIKLKADQDGDVEKVIVVPESEEELNLLNIPFGAIVNELDANNIYDIEKTDANGFEYHARIALGSDNAIVQTLFGVLGNLGTKVAIKEVEFANPAAGIDFYFTLSADKTEMTAFFYSMEIAFPVEDVPVTLVLNYAQQDSNTEVVIPDAGLITDATGIANTTTLINNAINAVKSANTYSIDMSAINDFDPGASTLAIVDKYIARMYKNGDDFNHSYEYKSHTEEDGAETYKYTLANIQDGTTHLVSRKGTNEITAVSGVSANSQFEYLIAIGILSASDISSIMHTTDGETTTYHLYTKASKSIDIQNDILSIVNSNDADGVIDANNYFNSSNHTIEDAEIVVEMKNGVIVSLNVLTKIKYVPTGGDYTDKTVTLTNKIELVFNENLDKAAEYEAPKSTSTGLSGVGLNNAKFYIL